ncbi:hypothetical protein OS493_027267 [Desmophyllum pertusum]|uniref:Uncharacterized protein n=1 Tax=Desmophyllum pertusum TaxID=174260 RepID=A0A9W9ZA92_9CNID|nr:hypothetical protein OS493_027267 [Desmophyllum pertusum]
MVFGAWCCCSRHSAWKHGKVDSTQLRCCTREETRVLNLAQEDPKNKGRKRKICVYCQSRLEIEVKCSKLEDACRGQDSDNNVCPEADVSLPDYEPVVNFVVDDVPVPTCPRFATCDKGSQRPSVPDIAYKNQCERRKRESRSEIIGTVKEAALKSVHFIQADLPEFVTDVTSSKKWNTTFGIGVSSSKSEGTANNPT